jgi:hypothetical protein
MQKTTVYMDEEAYRQLKQIARRQQRSPAAMIREAVAEFTARHAQRKKPRSIGAFKSELRDLGSRAEELLTGFGKD